MIRASRECRAELLELAVAGQNPLAQLFRCFHSTHE